MLMANYGTSEYVQSFSRVGSIFGAIYILNDRDLSISNPVINEDKLETIDFSMNATPLRPKEGFIIGKEYEHLFNKAVEDDLFTSEKCYPIVCQRMVIITHIELANSDRGPPIFSIPPTGINEEESKAFDLQNKHPIRIIQQGASSNITPRGFYCYHVSMVQDFEDRHDFSVLLKLKDALFGIDSDVILGESRVENKHIIVQSMMDIMERKQEEENRIKKYRKENEQIDEEERQMQEAIRQSLEGQCK